MSPVPPNDSAAHLENSGRSSVASTRTEVPCHAPAEAGSEDNSRLHLSESSDTGTGGGLAVVASSRPLGIVAASAFGAISAVLYTGANIALRQCVGVDPILVSAMKAIPTVIFLGPLVLVMAIRGRTLVTDTRMIPRFAAAALVAQFVGNVSFQISLGIIGLAAAVPITLGTLIVGGAMLGRLILGEPVRRRTIIAMVLLITAVVVLSLPEGTQPTEVTEDAGLPVWLGGVFAAASGAAYGLFGVVMRQTLTGGVTAPLTLLISGTVGTVSLWSLTYARMTIDDLSAVALQQWLTMFAAGLFNFAAFVALASSLKVLPVVAVNLINASQVAMAALAGVLLFAEPVTATLLAGIVLTVAGLVALANPRRPKLKRSAAN